MKYIVTLLMFILFTMVGLAIDIKEVKGGSRLIQDIKVRQESGDIKSLGERPGDKQVNIVSGVADGSIYLNMGVMNKTNNYQFAEAYNFGHGTNVKLSNLKNDWMLEIHIDNNRLFGTFINFVRSDLNFGQNLKFGPIELPGTISELNSVNYNPETEVLMIGCNNDIYVSKVSFDGSGIPNFYEPFTALSQKVGGTLLSAGGGQGNFIGDNKIMIYDCKSNIFVGELMKNGNVYQLENPIQMIGVLGNGELSNMLYNKKENLCIVSFKDRIILGKVDSENNLLKFIPQLQKYFPNSRGKPSIIHLVDNMFLGCYNYGGDY